MKKFYILSLFIVSFSLANAQHGDIISQGSTGPFTPDFGMQTRASGDSCGYYFNNYIGLAKTSIIYIEPMRVGNATESGYYSGRAQRFTASQPIEVGGVEFYAWVQNSAMDSIMVITSIHDYNFSADSLGVELTSDTVYVTHTAFDIILPNISVKSYFDNPVTVTSDYIVSIRTNTDDSLWIVTNDYTVPDGAGENLSHAWYTNPFYPTYIGTYSIMTDFAYDYDYLISPYIKYDLHNSFTILDDSICPGVIGGGCINYTQVPNFSNQHYNSQAGTPTANIVWLWGDGFQNTMITSGCHTYNNPGTYMIDLKDTLYRYDYSSPACSFNIQKAIYIEDSVFADFTSSSAGLTADFVNTSTNYDSVWWDFGDLTTGTNIDSPSHTYGAVGTYDVWLYAYNDCFEDSIMYQVTVDDVGLNEGDFEFSVYPNPANNSVIVNGIPGGATISIINLVGQEVMKVKATGSKEIIETNNLSTGSYFIRVSFNDYQTTQKLIIKH